MRGITRFWPALVVGCLWLTFLTIRAFVSPNQPAETQAAPEFFEYKRPDIALKPVETKHRPIKPARENVAKPPPPEESVAQERVQSPSPAPAELPKISAQADPPSAPVEERTTKHASDPAPVPTHVQVPAPDPDIRTVDAGQTSTTESATSPAREQSLPDRRPSEDDQTIALSDLPRIAERTLKGAMLTIEIQPPSGISRDKFLSNLGAQRVSETQLWDTNVIARFELSGQVYVFRLSDGGRVLLPPVILSKIITELEKETGGAPLYKGRIRLGPLGEITVKEVEVL